jgi:hypothetical protein
MLTRGCVISKSGGDLIAEDSKVLAPAVYLYACMKPAIPLVPADALVL